MGATIDELRAKVPVDMGRKVKVTLMFHTGRGARISKETLCKELFGKYTPTTDRQIRDLVACLQEEGELIVADMEDGGYFYAGTVEEAERYIADIQSRMKKLEVKRNALLRAMQAAFKRVPAREQMNLL